MGLEFVVTQQSEAGRTRGNASANGNAPGYVDISIGMSFLTLPTFDSVFENISFLKKIVGDGSASVVYCKMLPYSGTAIEEKLFLDSPLKGSHEQQNYDFKSAKFDYFYRHIEQNLRYWVQGSKSVSRYIDAVWQEAAVLRRLYPETNNLLTYESFIRKFTKQTIEIILSYLEVSAKNIMEGNIVKPRHEIMKRRANQQIQKLLEQRNNYFLDIQDWLVEKKNGDAWIKYQVRYCQVVASVLVHRIFAIEIGRPLAEKSLY